MSGLTLSIIAGGSAFALVVTVVVVLALRRDTGAVQADQQQPRALETFVATTPPNLATGAPEPPVSTSRTTTPTFTSDTPANIIPAGFRQVTGPGGITVYIPADWPVKPGAVPSNQQADDPRSAEDFVRFGGSPSPAMSLLDSIIGNERNISSIREGYQRLTLAQVPSEPDAVDWEFTFIKDGGNRHAYGRYWRTGGTDYVVYASSSSGNWVAMRPIVDVMVRTAGP